MKSFVESFLLVANIISFIGVVAFCLFGLYEYIMGPIDAKKLIQKLNVPLSYNKVLLVGFICVGLTIVLFIVRLALFGEN